MPPVGSHMYSFIVLCDHSRKDALLMISRLIGRVFCLIIKSISTAILFAIYGFDFLQFRIIIMSYGFVAKFFDAIVFVKLWLS